MREKVVAATLATVLLFTPFWCRGRGKKAAYTFGDPNVCTVDLYVEYQARKAAKAADSAK